jgi:hypothetical protein
MIAMAVSNTHPAWLQRGGPRLTHRETCPDFAVYGEFNRGGEVGPV